MKTLPWRRLAAWSLMLIGLGMLGYYYGTGLYTDRIQTGLQADWAALKVDMPQSSAGAASDDSTSAAASVADAKPVAKATVGRRVVGDIFGRLTIPRLGLDTIVLEGADRATLRMGPGHIRATAWPHEGRNTVISGHRTTFGAPFARLNKLRAGDVVLLTLVNGSSYRYKVSGRDIVRPNDLAVIGQDFSDRLTLTTCDPPGSAAKRLAVWAQQI